MFHYIYINIYILINNLFLVDRRGVRQYWAIASICHVTLVIVAGVYKSPQLRAEGLLGKER